MRITGGLARGIILTVPNSDVRPATDFTRTQIFNKIGAEIIGSVVIDYFAGTGAYGLEALSRGAKIVHFIEQNAVAICAIKENISKVCKSADIDQHQAANVVNGNVFKKEFRVEYADFIFFDPPYQLYSAARDLIINAINKIFSTYPMAKLIVEMPRHFKPKNDELICTATPNTTRSQTTIFVKNTY